MTIESNNSLLIYCLVPLMNILIVYLVSGNYHWIKTSRFKKFDFGRRYSRLEIKKSFHGIKMPLIPSKSNLTLEGFSQVSMGYGSPSPAVKTKLDQPFYGSSQQIQFSKLLFFKKPTLDKGKRRKDG